MSSEHPSPIWETLSAYLSNALSDVERATVERRLEAEPELAATVSRLRRGLEVSAPVIDISGAGAALEQLRQELLVRAGSAFPGRGPSPWGVFKAQPLRERSFKPQSLQRWTLYTAVGVALAVSLVLAGQHSVVRRLQQDGGGTATTYATRRGERADVTLPDGSMVTLNVESRLQVPADFAAGNRTVTLTTGEAVFHVGHHTGAPFTVIAGKTPTRVLGTTFLVRRYPTDTATTVTVRDGKVMVHSVVLSAQQQVAVMEDGAARLQPADLTQFSFVGGVLTLNNMPLSQAIEELDRWYDADIRLGDSAVRNHVLNATFIAGSLSDLSEVLTLALNVRVVRNGRVLTLYTR